MFLTPPAAANRNVDHLLRQVIAAMIQRRPFIPSFHPSPSFSGWTSDLICTILASIPRFFFLSPRSIGRQQLSSRHRSPLRQRFLRREARPFRPSAHRDHSVVLLGVYKALEFYSWVQFSHDESTCHEMARLLAKSNILPPLWRFLRSNEHLVNIATVTTVIKILGEQGLAKEALAAFYRMKQLHCKPDVQCYNTVIAALCRVGDFKTARSLLEQMELPGARCPTDTYTYTILISFYCKRSMQTGCRKAIRRRIWEANHMFRRMLFKGFVPDIVTYNCLIDGLCKTYRIGRAHELFNDMLMKGCIPNRVTYNSFIRYYSVVNEVDKAIEMMKEMVDRKHGMPSSSSYTPVIHALCENGRVNEAREFLLEMVNGGHVPREFTYKLVCDALSRSGEEGLPEEVLRRVEEGIDVRFRQVLRVKPLMQVSGVRSKSLLEA
ncbi:pentatricopeptide repeat-containing protein At1g77405 [Phalaenopsis equestris]|uniref:pentatricopeptide repeat-containing protein At1g77405 n=1 Tax=Phalaenopsis equestris TaxID=78828 RepID=UPI0009E438CC|nr:pentatricopeptide repeat-containing protein At1g77405 [Phalaenopsis equestris]